jgi:superfamily II DNA or RNA helicase
LRRWLDASMTIRGHLQSMPPVLTERLRDCQIDAVTRLEASLAADHPRALIQMATGAGKTYTACVLSHRLLEHAKFRRVPFLADRANLVRQTRHEFEDFRPPGTGRSFIELYNVRRLGPAGLDKDASVVIATIQRVYSLLTAEVFGQGNDFAKKITYRIDGADPEQLIRQFRTDYNPRIAVTVDMIATGTDVKPLEVLIFFARREVGALFRADKGPRRAHDHVDAAAPGDAGCRGENPLCTGRCRRRDGEPQTRRAALGPRAENRLQPAHRRYRRGPPRRRRDLDFGGASPRSTARSTIKRARSLPTHL